MDRFLAMAFGLSVVLSSCQGDGIGLTTSGDPFAVGFAAQIQPIFDVRCVRCHAPGLFGFTQTGGDQGNGLDLTRSNSHRSLVDQPSFQAPDVPPLLRVRPGQPDDSYIIQKIASAPPKSGERMPLFGPPFLGEGEIQLIRDWISRGARND